MMRKLAAILLCLFVCLLCSRPGEAVVADSDLYHGTVFTYDHSASDAWLCERACNSDLGMPRVFAERTPSVTTHHPLREARNILRAGIRCGVAGGRAGNTVHAVAEFNNTNISAGTFAVDYYVYRLRRLII